MREFGGWIQNLEQKEATSSGHTLRLEKVIWLNLM